MTDNSENTQYPILLFVSWKQTRGGTFAQRLERMGYRLAYIDTTEDLNSLEDDVEPGLAIVAVDCKALDPGLQELLESIKVRYSDIFVLGVFSGQLQYHARDAFEVGIQKLYHLGYEDETIVNTIFQQVPIQLSARQLSPELLARVNILDMEKAPELPYDVYVCLPFNSKVIHYRRKGAELESRVVDKFKTNEHFSLFINKLDLPAYLDQTTQVLQDIQSDESLSDSQKTKKVANELKKLMNGFFTTNEFSEEEGSQLLSHVSQVVEKLEDKSGPQKQLVDKVNSMACQYMTNQTHAQNVAVYCVLFGAALGISDLQALRMGGFLHDVGLADMDHQISTKDPEDMDDQELAQYQLHPGHSKLILNEKKLKLPEMVVNMIVQHHERLDGSGFPYGLTKNEIDPAAQVCALANEFDKLTSIRMGYKTYTPAEAIQKMAGLSDEAPSPHFDPESHMALVHFFLEADEPILEQEVAVSSATAEGPFGEVLSGTVETSPGEVSSAIAEASLSEVSSVEVSPAEDIDEGVVLEAGGFAEASDEEALANAHPSKETNDQAVLEAKGEPPSDRKQGEEEPVESTPMENNQVAIASEQTDLGSVEVASNVESEETAENQTGEPEGQTTNLGKTKVIDLDTSKSPPVSTQILRPDVSMDDLPKPRKKGWITVGLLARSQKFIQTHKYDESALSVVGEEDAQTIEDLKVQLAEYYAEKDAA